MARVIVITPNPAIDVTYRVASDQPGLSHRVADVARRAGGKGLNVAATLRALGHTAHVVLPLGGWTGAWFEHRLDADDVSFTAVPIDGETRMTVATLPADGQHPTVFLEPGPSLTDADVDAFTAAVGQVVAAADALVVSGSLPPGMPANAVGDWVRAARAAGVTTVVDTSGDALLEAAAAGADLLKPNLSEACAATGAPDAATAAVRLRNAGARYVIISAGADGITSFGPDGDAHVSAIAGITGNPTGAGDAATAAITASFAADGDLPAALRHGAAAGAAAVLAPLAGEINPDAYRHFLTLTSTQTPTDPKGSTDS